MPVLKDAQCIRCGHVQELFMDGDETHCDAECGPCGKPRQHVSICTGGCKHRWRFQDMGGIDHTGYSECFAVKAGRPHPEAINTPEEADSATSDTLLRDGSVTHEQHRFSDEVRAERRERRAADDKRRAGKTPLHFYT